MNFQKGTLKETNEITIMYLSMLYCLFITHLQAFLYLSWTHVLNDLFSNRVFIIKYVVIRFMQVLRQVPKYLLTETDCREWRTWLDSTKWLDRTSFFRVFFFSCQLYFFPHSFSSSYFLPLFHCPISILMLPWASVWESTRAWVPHFLQPYWMELVLFGHQYSCVVTCLL